MFYTTLRRCVTALVIVSLVLPPTITPAAAQTASSTIQLTSQCNPQDLTHIPNYLLGEGTGDGPAQRALQKYREHYQRAYLYPPKISALYPFNAEDHLRASSGVARLRYLPFLMNEMHATVSKGLADLSVADKQFACLFKNYAQQSMLHEIRRIYIELCQFLKPDCSLRPEQARNKDPLSFDPPNPLPDLKPFFHTLRLLDTTPAQLEAINATYSVLLHSTKASTAHDIRSVVSNRNASASSVLPSLDSSGDSSGLSIGALAGIASGVALTGVAAAIGIRHLHLREKANRTQMLKRKIAEKGAAREGEAAGTYVPPEKVEVARAQTAACEVTSNVKRGSPGAVCELEDSGEVNVVEEEEEIVGTIKSAASSDEEAAAVDAAVAGAEGEAVDAGIVAIAEAAAEGAAEVALATVLGPELLIGGAVAGAFYLTYHFASSHEKAEQTRGTDSIKPEQYFSLLTTAVQANSLPPFNMAPGSTNTIYAQLHNHLRTRLLFKMLALDLIGLEGMPSSLLKLPTDSPYAFNTATSFYHLRGGDWPKAQANRSFLFSYYADYFDNGSGDLPTTQGPTFSAPAPAHQFAPGFVVHDQKGGGGFFAVAPRFNGTDKILRLVDAGNDRLGAALYSRVRDQSKFELSWQTGKLAVAVSKDTTMPGSSAVALSNTIATLVAEANGFYGTDLVQITKDDDGHHINVYSIQNFRDRDQGCALNRFHCTGYALFGSSEITLPDLSTEPRAIPADMDGDGVDEIVLLNSATGAQCDPLAVSDACTVVHVLKLTNRAYNLLGVTTYTDAAPLTVAVLDPLGTEREEVALVSGSGATSRQLTRLSLSLDGDVQENITQIPPPPSQFEADDIWLAIDSIPGGLQQDLARLHVLDDTAGDPSIMLQRYTFSTDQSGDIKPIVGAWQALAKGPKSMAEVEVTTESTRWMDASTLMLTFASDGELSSVGVERPFGTNYYQQVNPKSTIPGKDLPVTTLRLRRTAPNPTWLPPLPPESMKSHCQHQHRWGGPYTLGPEDEKTSARCSGNVTPGAYLTAGVFCEHLHTYGGNNTTVIDFNAPAGYCGIVKNKSERVPKLIVCEHFHEYAGSPTTYPFTTTEPYTVAGTYDHTFCE